MAKRGIGIDDVCVEIGVLSRKDFVVEKEVLIKRLCRRYEAERFKAECAIYSSLKARVITIYENEQDGKEYVKLVMERPTKKEVIRIEFPAGVRISRAMTDLIERAKDKGGTVVANINDIDIYADENSSARDLSRYYTKVREMLDYMENNGLDVSMFLTDEPYK